MVWRGWMMWVLSWFAALGAQAAPSNQQIQDIISDSGLLGLGAQVRFLTQQALSQSGANLGKQQQLVEQLAPLWAPKPLAERLTLSLTRLPVAQQQAIWQSLTAPLMQSARQKEQQAVKEQHSDEYLSYKRLLHQQPPPPQRFQLVQELNDAMHFSSMMLAVRETLYGRLQAQLPTWQPAANWQQKLATDSLDFLLYAYRSTPDDELVKLTILYQEPELQAWFDQLRTQLLQPAAPQAPTVPTAPSLATSDAA